MNSSLGTSHGSGSLLISLIKNTIFFLSYPAENSAWLHCKAGQVCGRAGVFVGCVFHAHLLFILWSCFYWLSWRHFLFFHSGGIFCSVARLSRIYVLMLSLRLSACGYGDRLRNERPGGHLVVLSMSCICNRTLLFCSADHFLATWKRKSLAWKSSMQW